MCSSKYFVLCSLLIGSAIAGDCKIKFKQGVKDELLEFGQLGRADRNFQSVNLMLPHNLNNILECVKFGDNVRLKIKVKAEDGRDLEHSEVLERISRPGSGDEVVTVLDPDNPLAKESCSKLSIRLTATVIGDVGSKKASIKWKNFRLGPRGVLQNDIVVEDIKDTSARIAWNATDKCADGYKIKIRNGISMSAMKEKAVTLTNLTPCSTLEVFIWPLFNGQSGKSAMAKFSTLPELSMVAVEVDPAVGIVWNASAVSSCNDIKKIDYTVRVDNFLGETVSILYKENLMFYDLKEVEIYALAKLKDDMIAFGKDKLVSCSRFNLSLTMTIEQNSGHTFKLVLVQDLSVVTDSNRDFSLGTTPPNCRRSGRILHDDSDDGDEQEKDVTLDEVHDYLNSYGQDEALDNLEDKLKSLGTTTTTTLASTASTASVAFDSHNMGRIMMDSRLSNNDNNKDSGIEERDNGLIVIIVGVVMGIIFVAMATMALIGLKKKRASNKSRRDKEEAERKSKEWNRAYKTPEEGQMAFSNQDVEGRVFQLPDITEELN